MSHPVDLQRVVRKRATWIAIVSAGALAACGAKKDSAKQQPAAGSGSAAGPAKAAGSGSAAVPTKAAGSGDGSGSAAVRPAKGPVPPAYRDGLAQGRKLTNAKKYPEAIAAFRAALAAVPDDPRVLSELSWALFLAKDPAARATAEQAVKVARNNVKAASLYNLGRILEDAGDDPGAANAYRESLVMRPNKTVAEHLSKVDPLARPAADALAIEEWGPAAPTYPKTCEGLPADDEGFADFGQDGTCEVSTVEVNLAGSGPFAQVTQVNRKRSGSDEAFIAVRTDDGWVLSPAFLSWGGVGAWGGTGAVTHAEVIDHPTLGPVLRLDVKTTEDARFEDWNTESTVLCLAPRKGGAPVLTCSPLLATSWLHTQDDDEAVDESCAATIALAADGAIELTSKGGKAPTDCPIHLGRSTWPAAR